MARQYRPAPPPLETNEPLVTGLITAGWAVALITLLVLRDHLPAGERWWIWTCALGLGMGLFGLWYVPHLKRMRARTQQRQAKARSRVQASSQAQASPQGQTPGVIGAEGPPDE